MPNKYRKYLNHARRKNDEKRTLVEVYKRRPIIKSDKASGMKDNSRYITFQIPVQSHRYTYNSGRIGNKARTISYQSCDSPEEARHYIDNYTEIRRKVILRNKIRRLCKKIQNIHKKIDDTRYKGLDSLVSFGFKKMTEHPRENTYCHHHNCEGKFTHKTIDRHGRKFSHSIEEHKIIMKCFDCPSDLSAEDIKFVINNLKEFNQDVEANLDIVLDDTWTEFYETYKTAAFQKKLRTSLKEIIELTLQKDVFFEEYGCDTRENIKIPEGYKMMKVGYYCWPGWTCDEDILAVQSKDETIEIIIWLGNGTGGYTGEVQYKEKKENGSYYSIGSRGINSAFSMDGNNPITIEELIVKQGDKARKRQERIRRSVDVVIGGRSWKVTPENVEEMKKLLKAGKSRTFLPSGMGIGVIIANSTNNLPYNLSKYNAGESIEKLLGMPVYAQDFEYD